MWGRVVKLSIGRFFRGNESAGDAYDLSALDIEFECYRSVEWYDNSATVTVYNPSPSTVSVLMDEGNAVVLQAGYEDGGVGTVFSGQISRCELSRSGTDIVAEITCVQARGNFYQLARLNMAVSFSASDTVKACLSAFCDYAGIALRASFPQLSIPIGHPYSRSGTFTDVIRDFSRTVLEPLCKVKLYCDNNELIVFGDGNTIALEEVNLGWDTGLLSCREIRDESQNKVNFGDDPAYHYFSGSDQECPEPKERPAKEIDREKTVGFTALLNAAIVPNGFVNLDSYRGDGYDSALGVRGRFIVTDCTYRGGNIGSDFTVECTAVERSVKTEA